MTTRHDMGHQRYRQRHLFLPTVSRNVSPFVLFFSFLLKTITSLIPLKEMRNSQKGNKVNLKSNFWNVEIQWLKVAGISSATCRRELAWWLKLKKTLNSIREDSCSLLYLHFQYLNKKKRLFKSKKKKILQMSWRRKHSGEERDGCRADANAIKIVPFPPPPSPKSRIKTHTSKREEKKKRGIS